MTTRVGNDRRPGARKRYAAAAFTAGWLTLILVFGGIARTQAVADRGPAAHDPCGGFADVACVLERPGSRRSYGLTAMLRVPNRRGPISFGPYRLYVQGAEALAPSGSEFAWVDPRARVHLVNLETGRKRLVGVGYPVSFSFDGRFLAAINAAGRLRIYDTQSHKTGVEPGAAGGFAWAHTSDTIAWRAGNALYTHSRHGDGGYRALNVAAVGPSGGHHSIRVPGRGDFGDVRWTANDSKLLYWFAGAAPPHELGFRTASPQTGKVLQSVSMPAFKTEGIPAAVPDCGRVLSDYPAQTRELFAITSALGSRGVPLEGGRGNERGGAVVNSRNCRVLVPWSRSDGSFGVAMWRPGDSKARELGRWADAFWLLKPADSL